MPNFFMRDLSDIGLEEIICSKSILIGLDIGTKTMGVSVSDSRIKIASCLVTINRRGFRADYLSLAQHLKPYKVGLVVVGWPVHLNGSPSQQCEKILRFCEELPHYIDARYAKWDERFSSSVVDRIMVEANLSRRKRQKVIDKTAAVYILQGAIDFLNHRGARAALKKD
jgi:putative Holliday junction resolvase